MKTLSEWRIVNEVGFDARLPNGMPKPPPVPGTADAKDFKASGGWIKPAPPAPIFAPSDPRTLAPIIVAKMKEKGIPLNSIMTSELISGTQGRGMGLDFSTYVGSRVLIPYSTGGYILNRSLVNI